MRPLSLLLLVAARFFLPAAPAAAQDGVPPLQLLLLPESGQVQPLLGSIMESEAIRSSLQSGLPVRIRVVTELWRNRFIDGLEGRHEWRATVRLDALTEHYRVELADDLRADVVTLAAVRSFLQTQLEVPLAPPRPGRYYYLGLIEVETLSLSDLEELRLWLRGDLGSATEGTEEVGGTLGRGLRRLLVRALSLPVQRYRTRTSTFEVGG